jgi:hypothetical protein
MRVIITGDRRWHAPDLAKGVVYRLLAKHGAGLVIVHGGATGIDESFAQACTELGVEQEAHPADWGDLHAPAAIVRQTKDGMRYNATAGPARNAEMVAAGAGMCIAFHRSLAWSRGTKDCVRRAIEVGIPCYLIDSEQARPRRLRAGDARLR